MEILIITGLSGAGKSRAADIIEDLDYYCVDNIPVDLIPKFAEFCIASGGRFEKVALVTDVREKSGFSHLLPTVDSLRALDCRCRILYMDADVPTLIRRYKESRRPHPLYEAGSSLEDAVQREIQLLSGVKGRADFIVNTSGLTLARLQSRLYSMFSDSDEGRKIDVTVVSFGYKYGIPLDADLVYDARFLPNPYYVDELRPLTGLDSRVSDYVFSTPQAGEVLDKLKDMIDYSLPYYIEEGKFSLTVAIGCTGGHHRSVALASALNRHLLDNGVHSVLINRDIEK